MQIVLISVCLFRTYHQTLRRIKHYQTKNLKIPHQKIIPSAQAFFCEKYRQTKEQAFTFFQEYPQYMRSKEDEEQLMTEFKKSPARIRK
ncbi:Invasion lipoprotein invH [Salmonella enterica subsp. arizonae]|uniref:Invasion lipoprotein invH n=1 Tax=Salmonella enterica subsp. arizonae TaxID=59203 RepID=A0A379T635_SALER|nr:Invasion lipoprotein invH [Salmonella enterica subsp. arizonae]